MLIPSLLVHRQSDLTNAYDAAYLNNGADNSMIELKSGYTDGGAADVMYINAVVTSN